MKIREKSVNWSHQKESSEAENDVEKKRMRTEKKEDESVVATSSTEKELDNEKIVATLNPEIVVKKHEFRRDDGKMISVNVFRDDVLEGGTKQRAMGVMIRDSSADRFVYAGPAEGYAQVALAYVCKLYGKKSTVVLPRRRDRRLHALTVVAKSHGVCVVEVPPRNGNGVARLKDVQAYAERMVKEHNEEKHEGDVMELLPFGLHCDEFVSELVQRLKDCIPETLRLKDPPKRLWTVAGSAALLASFAKVWPSTKFMVVQVGKKIWPDQIGHTKREGDGEGEFNGPRTFESELLLHPNDSLMLQKNNHLIPPCEPTMRNGNLYSSMLRTEITYGMSEGIVMRFYAMFPLRESTIVINVMIIAILTTEDVTVDGTIVPHMMTIVPHMATIVPHMVTDGMTTGGGISAMMTTVGTTGIAITGMMIDIIEEDVLVFTPDCLTTSTSTYICVRVILNKS